MNYFVKTTILIASLTYASLNIAYAGTCDLSIEATAQMAYTAKELAVPKTCKEITLNFKAAGTMGKAVMGHNVVISKTSDMQAVITDGITAGLAKNYVKPNDTRVIGHTIVIGGGEATSVKVNLSNLKPEDSYSFYCSFPGHGSVMKGVLKFV